MQLISISTNANCIRWIKQLLDMNLTYTLPVLNKKKIGLFLL